MKKLVEFIKEKLVFKYAFEKEHKLMLEMANIQKGVVLSSNRYNISVHGASSKDREYPHLHIYLTGDNSLKQFNFEISIIDLLCDDELNLIRQLDKTKKKKIDIKNRIDCSWEGYSKLKNDFEDWLEQPYKKIERQFKNNLDALIYLYNSESEDLSDNYILEYISKQNRKINKQYHYLFSEEEKNNYSECF